MQLRNGMPWPPRDPKITRALEEWDAWYTGDRSRLLSVYSRPGEVRPSQYSGGIVGGVARTLWGTPPPMGTHDRRMHLPLANDIASASADMLFGDDLQIDWGAPEAAAQRMVEILDGNQWSSLLAEAGEAAAGLGGVFLRAGWDLEVADHVIISTVPHDGAAPTFRYGHLVEVTFWEVLERRDDGKIWRHTDTHVPGFVIHQLWLGTDTDLGDLHPLTDHPATESLPVEEDFIPTGIDGLDVVYVPNIRPAPLWRNAPDGRYLGRSDFGNSGVIGFFDAVDEAWSSWMRDVRHGKSRLLVASSVLDTGAPGSGAWFDPDREVYEALRLPLGENSSVSDMISPQQFAIRVEEHSRTVKELVLAAVNSCGYSGSTFGLDNEVAKTATEVGAVRARTEDTWKKKTRYWDPQIEKFLGIVADLDDVVFHSGTRGIRPQVSFTPFSSPQPLALAQTAQALKAAQAASTFTLVRLIHPDWDGPQIDEEVEKITGENAPEPIVVSNPLIEQDVPDAPDSV